MTQNVDLQVKVKFVVDPKDLQNALSGGVGGGGGGATAAGAKGGAAPGAAGLHMPGSNIPRIALPPGFMSQMQALTRALTAQTVALNSRTRELISSKNSELKVEGQIARFKVQEELAEDKRHRSEMKRRADRMQEVLDAENLAKRIDAERKRRLDKSAQDEAQALRKSQLSARRVGKGYGSEGMFAAGTSPIMQGLAWQSLFATGDILGPMSFAPMALYQNYSLRRQRRNRGFDLGAGSDLAKAAGVGDTGQIATAGHALAALRANTALTPEERERRMAQVDIMSAGRVRGRLGRGIEMFESGQLGAGTQAVGALVGALGGVGSVALGAVAGLGAAGMALKVFDDRMKETVSSIHAMTNQIDAQRRASRLSLQENMEKGLAGDLGADLSALERAGISRELSPGMRGQAAAAVRSFGGDRAKLLLQLSEKAATLYDTTPEEAMQALIAGGAGRGSAEAASKRVPQIMATAFRATGDVRRTMRARWDTGVAPTEIGGFAEKYRGDVAYSEGKTFERFFNNAREVRLKIERLKKHEQFFADLERGKMPEGMDAAAFKAINFVLPERVKGFGAAKWAAGAERRILQSEISRTRTLAEDPGIDARNEAVRGVLQDMKTQDEIIMKQIGIFQALSTAIDTASAGLWETQMTKKTKMAERGREVEMRGIMTKDSP